MDAEGLEHECECPPGAPQWMATFADLSTLLMSFFVLLLAFSEMDVLKFKQLSGSMRDAFGVQTEVEVKTIPKGTSMITREFRPGRPDLTPVQTVRQYTIHSNQNTLEWLKNKGQFEEVIKVLEKLDEELDAKTLAVQWDQDTITIHIRERTSFDSGSAELKAGFVPVLHKIRALLGELQGDIRVEGHTDDIPIATARFRSNWELSASRAVSVAHELLADETLAASRFTIVGHADTQPVESNDTAEGRAANRRVDVQIKRVRDGESGEFGDVASRLGAIIGTAEGGMVQLALPESLAPPEGAEAPTGEGDADVSREGTAATSSALLPAAGGGLAPVADEAATGEETPRENVPVAPAGAPRQQVYDEDI